MLWPAPPRPAESPAFPPWRALRLRVDGFDTSGFDATAYDCIFENAYLSMVPAWRNTGGRKGSAIWNQTSGDSYYEGIVTINRTGVGVRNNVAGDPAHYHAVDTITIVDWVDIDKDPSSTVDVALIQMSLSHLTIVNSPSLVTINYTNP